MFKSGRNFFVKLKKKSYRNIQYYIYFQRA